MFRHTETMDAERRATASIAPSRLADRWAGTPVNNFSRFRRTVRDRLDPVLNAFGPCRDEGLIEKPSLDQNMAHRIEQGDVRAWPQLQMQIGQPRQLRAPGIDDDQGHPSPMRLLILAPTTGWDSVGFAPTTHNQLSQIEILNGIVARRAPSVSIMPVTVALWQNAGAVVDVVRSDHATHELRKQIILFVRFPDWKKWSRAHPNHAPP